MWSSTFTRLLTIAVAGLVLLPTSGFGEEDEKKAPRVPPYLKGEISTSIQVDHKFKSNDLKREVTKAEGSVDAEIELWLSPLVSVHSETKLDSVKDPPDGKDAYFANPGLVVDRLFVQLGTADHHVFAGKYDVDFALAWDKEFGLYGSELVEDYEIEKRLGVGGTVTVAHKSIGKHVLTGSVFSADTSHLSNSLITRKGRLRLADGGVSNTESLSSFAAALHSDFGLPYKLKTHSSVSIQKASMGDRFDQVGLSFALTGEFPVAEDLSLEWLSEFTRLEQAEGNDEDRNYFTASGKLKYNDAWLALTVTHRADQVAGARDMNTLLATISVGYDFDRGFKLSAGYLYVKEFKTRIHSLGIKAEYELEF